MIVYCEECGAKNVLDEDQLLPLADPIRCRYCNDVLMIYHENIPFPSPPSVQETVVSRLFLTYQGMTIEHPGPKHEITLGRHEGADIRVQNERVSRTHARIVYKSGKYCILDQSLNGTYVLINNRHGRTIKHKEIMLIGQGIIGLGDIVDDASPHTIHYQIRSL